MSLLVSVSFSLCCDLTRTYIFYSYKRNTNVSPLQFQLADHLHIHCLFRRLFSMHSYSVSTSYFFKLCLMDSLNFSILQSLVPSMSTYWCFDMANVGYDEWSRYGLGAYSFKSHDICTWYDEWHDHWLFAWRRQWFLKANLHMLHHRNTCVIVCVAAVWKLLSVYVQQRGDGGLRGG